MTAHSISDPYPLASTSVQTSMGPQPTPYHVYDGHLALIGGTAGYAAVNRLLVQEQVTPDKTQSGRALMAVYMVYCTPSEV